MRIGLVSQDTLSAFKEKNSGENTDITVFGFNGMGEVSYEKELKGESGFFEDVAVLSKRNKNIVVCGCITDTRGHKRKSVVVAENGRLLGVSDMLHVIDGKCGSGANLRVYETKAGKMGIVVAEDLYFPETVKALALCGSDFIVCPFGELTSSLGSVYLRAYAHAYGTPILLCGKGFCTVADPKGEIVFSSPVSPAYVSYENKKEYHLVEMRKRGIYQT